MYPHRKAGTEVTGKSIMASSHLRTGVVGITIDADAFTLGQNLDADYIIDIGSLFGKMANGLYRLWARQLLTADSGGTSDTVEVKNAKPFKVGDAITIGDDDGSGGDETEVILSIDYANNILTMTGNITGNFTLNKNAEIWVTDGGEIADVVLGYSDVDMELAVRATTSAIADQTTSVLKHGAVLFARLPQWVQDALTYVKDARGVFEDGPKRFLEGKGGNQIEFVE